MQLIRIYTSFESTETNQHCQSCTPAVRRHETAEDTPRRRKTLKVVNVLWTTSLVLQRLLQKSDAERRLEQEFEAKKQDAHRTLLSRAFSTVYHSESMVDILLSAEGFKEPWVCGDYPAPRDENSQKMQTNYIRVANLGELMPGSVVREMGERIPRTWRFVMRRKAYEWKWKYLWIPRVDSVQKTTRVKKRFVLEEEEN
ncbi:hypothetical protein BDZ91DRAFT_798759 [Kalaharituber pfeilii]|nr:hypothetical protein BDZ91DRAFT_798759 [Kalaharituber pfeilii]